MNNENVYIATGTKPWCKTIKARRLRWFGHAIRLPEDTTEKKALAYAKENFKRTKGRRATALYVEKLTKLQKQLNKCWLLKTQIFYNQGIQEISYRN